MENIEKPNAWNKPEIKKEIYAVPIRCPPELMLVKCYQIMSNNQWSGLMKKKKGTKKKLYSFSPHKGSIYLETSYTHLLHLRFSTFPSIFFPIPSIRRLNTVLLISEESLYFVCRSFPTIFLIKFWVFSNT